MTMDYIRTFEVELDKQVYFAGDLLTGNVLLEVEENMRMQNIRVFLRGKAHTEWKITRAGERRTMKQDEQYIDKRLLIWGKDETDPHQGIPICTRGRHRYPFQFQLPDTAMPCSFESKIGTVRYYVRVNINIPYASCPQAMRYFTIIGPLVDCMDERYLVAVQAVSKRNSCSLCCGKGQLVLRACLERTCYTCGEQIQLKAEVQNDGDSEVWVTCKMMQYVEFFINKGVLGLTKEIRHTVLQAESDKVPAHDTSSLNELMGRLQIPVMPPTMVDICGLVQIYYTLKLYLETSKGKSDTAEINMPISIATVPYRSLNGPPTEIHYDNAAPHVEGGMYISTEFQLGQVYMGDEVDPEDHTILYRPVYVCTSLDRPPSDPNLLQVPSRQTVRSRENTRESKEAIAQEAMTSSEASKLKMAKPEDKFLQEISARIAKRQIGAQTEGGGPGDDDDKGALIQSNIDAHVDLMRKQKQTNECVHKALVSELRRHLSDDQEGVGVEPTPPLKKGLRKAPNVAPKGNEQVTSVETSHQKVTKDYVTQPQLVDSQKEWKSHDSMEKHGLAAESQINEFKDVQVRVKETHEYDEVEEASEKTALLLDNQKTSIQKEVHKETTIRKSGEISTTVQETSTQNGSSMQSTKEEFTHVSDIVATSSVVSSGSDFIPEENLADTVQLLKEEEAEKHPLPASDATHQLPGHQEGSASSQAMSSSPSSYSPKVAPKPKQKDRHSFPAFLMSEDDKQIAGLSVDVKGRPKSEFVEYSKKPGGAKDTEV